MTVVVVLLDAAWRSHLLLICCLFTVGRVFAVQVRVKNGWVGQTKF